MNNIKRVLLIKQCVRPNIRKVSTTPSLLTTARALVKLKKQQAEFQCEDGKPIWLKGGFCDRILYTSTLIGCVVGFLSVLVVFYDHAKPESWKTATTC